MKSVEFTIQNKVGLHARPATLFVKAAQAHQSIINVSYDGKTVNAKSLLSLLTLGAAQGAVITVTAEGSDESDAIAALTSLVDTNFGE
jgi:phosphocarrier protein HPr